MRNKRVLMFACIVATLVSGCYLPSPSTVCTPGQLAAPALSSPAMWEVVSSLTPTLSWTAADPSGPYPYADCHPMGYKVQLSSGIAIWGPGYTDSSTTSWVPAPALLPGKEYSWGVSAMSGTSAGPYAGDRIFFTGPYCATSALAAPSLIGPANGSLVNTLQPTLEWQYPDPCLPQGYRVDLSTSATFADTSLSGGTGNPSTRWGPGSDLTNCTWYYWRVAPINDTTLGPYSITRSFMVNIGSGCIYPIPAVIGPTLVPTTVPSSTPTPTPALILPPGFVFQINANCRKGPDLVYGVVTSYLAGQSFLADGRNEQGTWLRLKINETARCWVALSSGQYNGDVMQLPILPDPPTPVPTARITGTPTPLRNRKP